MAELVKSERVDGPNGSRVQVLFYDDESIRFRIYESPLVIEEAFLTGNQNQHSIIKVAPRVRAADQAEQLEGLVGNLRAAEGERLLREFLERFAWISEHPDYFDDVRQFLEEEAKTQ